MYHKKVQLFKLFLQGIALLFTAGVIFVLTQPYVIIDFSEFLSQAKLPEKVKTYYFSLEQKADFSGRILEEKDEHTLLEVSTESSSLVLALPFRGRAFLYDFLAAFAVAFLLGVPLSDIKKT